MNPPKQFRRVVRMRCHPRWLLDALMTYAWGWTISDWSCDRPEPGKPWVVTIEVKQLDPYIYTFDGFDSREIPACRRMWGVVCSVWCSPRDYECYPVIGKHLAYQRMPWRTRVRLLWLLVWSRKVGDK